jgi:clan AA aspartic protease (TIGR02281 family)
MLTGMKRLLLTTVAALALGACSYEVIPASPARQAEAPQSRLVRAQMTMGTSGNYYVDVGIAGVCCIKMMLDTGASDVSVPRQLFEAMVEGGHVTRDDLIGVVNYRTANGVVEGMRFRMPPMQIAGITVDGVAGSVTRGDTGSPILLGQSFLQKFKAWSINNNTGQLVLAY